MKREDFKHLEAACGGKITPETLREFAGPRWLSTPASWRGWECCYTDLKRSHFTDVPAVGRGPNR